MIHALKILLTSSSKSNMDDKNRESIIKLKFIGTFLPGEKVDVKNLKIETSSIITPIKRMFYGESRETTYVFLNNTIDRTFEIISSNCHSERISDKLFCKNIVADLVRAVTGLKNIQKTYKDDKLFYCNIESIIENIDAKLTELKNNFEDIFTIQDNIYDERILPDKLLSSQRILFNKVQQQLDVFETPPPPITNMSEVSPLLEDTPSVHLSIPSVSTPSVPIPSIPLSMSFTHMLVPSPPIDIPIPQIENKKQNKQNKQNN